MYNLGKPPCLPLELKSKFYAIFSNKVALKGKKLLILLLYTIYWANDINSNIEEVHSWYIIYYLIIGRYFVSRKKWYSNHQAGIWQKGSFTWNLVKYVYFFLTRLKQGWRGSQNDSEFTICYLNLFQILTIFVLPTLFYYFIYVHCTLKFVPLKNLSQYYM